MRATLQERFDSKYEAIPFSGCWIWTGAIIPQGYGTIEVNGKTVGAHRVSYELHRGQIPKCHVIDHLCKMPGCVNPHHLEAVTQSQNVRRGNLASVTKALGKAVTHCKWGHEYSLKNTYIDKKGRRNCRMCNSHRSLRKHNA